MSSETDVSEMPSWAANLRVLQCVAPAGFVSVVMRTLSAASMVGLRPRPGRSEEIATTPPLENLSRHAITCPRLIPSRRAIS